MGESSGLLHRKVAKLATPLAVRRRGAPLNAGDDDHTTGLVEVEKHALVTDAAPEGVRMVLESLDVARERIGTH